MLKFTKMQGLGNDYVYVDCTKNGEPHNVMDLARFVSNRHFGVGSDGLILIGNSKVADFKMRMFNADGSEAQMCGNGIRCVGKFVYEKGLTTKRELTIETLAGIKGLTLSIKEGKVDMVTVDMGEPILEPQKIPVLFEKKPVIGLNLKAFDKEWETTCVSMGNPHAVIKVEKVSDFRVETYGPILEKDPHFPEKANIEFVEVICDTYVKMRVWERGSGETMACGTGACAVAVACILQQWVKDTVIVELLGGTLQIQWNKQNNHIYMTGPATIVFEGEIEW